MRETCGTPAPMAMSARTTGWPRPTASCPGPSPSPARRWGPPAGRAARLARDAVQRLPRRARRVGRLGGGRHALVDPLGLVRQPLVEHRVAGLVLGGARPGRIGARGSVGMVGAWSPGSTGPSSSHGVCQEYCTWAAGSLAAVVPLGLVDLAVLDHLVAERVAGARRPRRVRRVGRVGVRPRRAARCPRSSGISRACPAAGRRSARTAGRTAACRCRCWTAGRSPRRTSRTGCPG